MTRATSRSFNTALAELGQAAGVPLPECTLRAQDLSIDSRFRAAEGAAAALAAGAGIANEIAQARGQPPGTIELASRHVEASLLSFAHLRFNDPQAAPAARLEPESRTAVAGFFATADNRWIYLHPGFPHNTAGLLQLLAVDDDGAAVRDKVAGCRAELLEDEIAAAGLCGAMVRTAQEWDESAAGNILNTCPVVDIVRIGDSDPEPFPTDHARPLAGCNVLDLTRILAGPTCARTLASYGATALRVSAEDLPSIPLFVTDTGFGKRACHLDLKTKVGRAVLQKLVGEADVFSQGYRSGAMDRLGFSPDEVASQRPGIVYVSINCYGHEGDWSSRPGWEQLAQTVTGMAAQQGEDRTDGVPTLLPVAVNDYTTGYLAAFGTLVALQQRARSGGSYWVRVSLARTAMWLRNLGLRPNTGRTPFRVRPLAEAELERMSSHMDSTWGELRYLRPAVELSNVAVNWQAAPVPLGSHSPSFSSKKPG